MAQVQTKKEETRYAHLQKVYETQKTELVETPEEKAEVRIKLQETTISRKEILTNIGLVALLGLLSASGYLISRFV